MGPCLPKWTSCTISVLRNGRKCKILFVPQQWSWRGTGKWPCPFVHPFVCLPYFWGFHAFADKQLIIFWIELKFGKGSWTHDGTLQAWLTVGHALLISSRFLASDWSSSFRAFTDKLLKRLSTNLVDELIIALLRPDYLLVMLRWIPAILWLLIVQQFLRICRQRADQIELKFGGPTNYGAPLAWPTYGHALLNSLISWPLICQAVSAHLQINCWWDWAQIWWMNS